MTQAVSGCGGGSSRDRIRLTRLMWRKLSRQDHYHVPDHRSWYDLFCTLNQLNKGLACVVREQ